MRDKAGMKELQACFERDKKLRPLFEEVGQRAFAGTHGADKVRALLLSVCRLRLGVGGLPAVSPKDAQLQGEALAEPLPPCVHLALLHAFRPDVLPEELVQPFPDHDAGLLGEQVRLRENRMRRLQQSLLCLPHRRRSC